MAAEVNLLQELKGVAGNLPGDRFSRRERLFLKETSGPMGMVTALYDFSVSGGAVSTIGLGVSLPANCIVTRLFTDVLTSFTSGGAATVAIEAGATVLLAATAFNAAALTGADAQSLTAVKLSAASELEVVIAAAALTAGKMRIFVEYIQSEA